MKANENVKLVNITPQLQLSQNVPATGNYFAAYNAIHVPAIYFTLKFIDNKYNGSGSCLLLQPSCLLLKSISLGCSGTS